MTVRTERSFTYGTIFTQGIKDDKALIVVRWNNGVKFMKWVTEPEYIEIMDEEDDTAIDDLYDEDELIVPIDELVKRVKAWTVTKLHIDVDNATIRQHIRDTNHNIPYIMNYYTDAADTYDVQFLAEEIEKKVEA